jgi:ribosomal protein S18 acetylase RimI-like enzyme
MSGAVVTLDEAARLRRAEPGDLDALIAIKRSLPMPRADQTAGGGFLLASEVEVYRELLAVARIWLLELDGVAVGFSLTLDDPVLRASAVWARREAITWEPDFSVGAALDRRIAYFDQLAVLPAIRHRYWGAALALRALVEQFDERGHDLVLTTTVVEPIINRAALPYLARVGARLCGRIEERYQAAGRVVSAIYVVEADRYREHITALADTGRPATRRIVRLIDMIDANPPP